MTEQPNHKKAPNHTAIASNKTDHCHGFAFLVRSPRTDLLTGTMPTENPEYGSQKKNNDE